MQQDAKKNSFTHSPLTHPLTDSLTRPEKQKQDLQKKVWVVHKPCLLGSGSEIINRLLTVSKKLHDTVCPSVGYPDQWSNDEIIYAKYPFSRRLSAWQPQSLPFHQLPLCTFPLEIPVPTSYPFFPPHPATPSPESRHAPVLRVMKLFFLASPSQQPHPPPPFFYCYTKSFSSRGRSEWLGYPPFAGPQSQFSYVDQLPPAVMSPVCAGYFPLVHRASRSSSQQWSRINMTNTE